MEKLICVMLVLSLLTGCGSTIAASAPEPLAEEKVVALTFDDGPRRATTERLLDALKEREVPVTFFLIGEQLEGQEDLVRRMADEGHQVGSHTWSHADLAKLGDTEADQERGRTGAALTELLGPGSYWLRPPYGHPGPRTPDTPVILWSVDPRDWESRDADAVTEHVLSHVTPGDIILLHDIYDTSVDAAIRIVDDLTRQGYRFVTVQELLGADARPGVQYRRKD